MCLSLQESIKFTSIKLFDQILLCIEPCGKYILLLQKLRNNRFFLVNKITPLKKIITFCKLKGFFYTTWISDRKYIY